ncbi:DUF6074 family protein [Mesorhizobium kowhaii]|uniref:Uncharacterized protein n=1 Tax=Mesorhizobium kowhaii TaxID=1300272 RepID=A0A2W7C2D7_9HYPH|nr:DUF6074 family protein [Mesorhizobium kowhaii]PZV36481.1 hypothetical protein B5V02_22150 [Mesorhizobium kowhaii]
MHEHDGVPLFEWQPAAKVILFPMVKRVGRIRDVAAKTLAKPTLRAAQSYRDQVTDALIQQMSGAGIGEAEQDEQLGAFWSAVQAEIARQTYHGQRV